MTHWTTDIYVYSSDSIPRPPLGASKALHQNGKRPSRVLTESDHQYVAVAFHTIGKDRLPTANEFNSLKTQSLNIKDKFGLLKNVTDGTFADVIAEVVREPYEMGDKLTIWVSDYTENSMFYSHVFKGFNSDGQDADPYNYTLRFSNVDSSDGEWAGPYGKMSLQMTCFEPHAMAVREQHMGLGSWVLIRNLQIKYGHNAANLEGYLRGEQNGSMKVNIALLDHREDGSTMDPRLKEAIRRKRDYERAKSRQMKSLTEAAKAGQKRKAAVEAEAGLPPKSNSRSKRSAKRAAVFQKAAESELSLIPVEGINDQSTHLASLLLLRHSIADSLIVQCEHPKKPISSVGEILEQAYYTTEIKKEEVKLPLPFINANYRTNVHVVDFFPPKLEDFAFPKRARKDRDALSDNSESSSDEDSDEEGPDGTLGTFSRPEDIESWEWRFCLQLEDAVVPPKEKKRRVWVVVDNQAAQFLTNLDASDLHQNSADVARLRDALSTVWGDLEERKMKRELERERREKAARQNRPPADSDDEDGKGEKKSSDDEQVQNRPFSCCVRQYGIKVPEQDDAKANAGEGQRWKRMYGLFGVCINQPRS